MEIERKKLERQKTGRDVAGETLDKTFAKTYENYIAQGGKQSLLQSIKILREARDELAALPEPPRGVGAFGQKGIDLLAPAYSRIMNKVRGVVQGNLRNFLGSAFTEKEGEEVMGRSFNPRLPKATNLENIDREIDKIVGKAEAFQKSVDYFEKNGTLRGFQSGGAGDRGKPIKKQINRKLNQTRFTYSDGSTETVEGIQ